MGVPGRLGAVSDLYRISYKWSDEVKEKPRLRSFECTSAAFGGVMLWALALEENGKFVGRWVVSPLYPLFTSPRPDTE